MHHRRVVEKPEVAAFEGSAPDPAEHGHAEIVEALFVVELLSLTLRLAKAADQRSLGQASSEVTCIDHIRQCLYRLHELDGDTCRAVRVYEKSVLFLHGLQVHHLTRSHDLLRYLIDGLKAEIRGWTKQDLCELARRVWDEGCHLTSF